MSRLKNIIRYRFELKPWYDYYIQLGFRYHNLFFCSLVNDGKKLKAFNFFLSLKSSLKLKEFVDPYNIFLISFMNITPQVFLRTFKLGSVRYGIGMPISERKKISFAIKWSVKLLKDKYGGVTINNLSDLIINSLYNRGESYKLKIEVHRLAKINRFFIKRYYK